MSTPDFEVHRALVVSSNINTGDATVVVPALLGAHQQVAVPKTGLTQTSGLWNVPSPGATVFVAVSTDRTQFFWLTAVTAPSSGDDRDVVDSLQFNIDAGIVVDTEGLLAWNEDWGTVDIGLHGSNAVLHVGQQMYYYAKNQTGAQIDKGTVVRFDGALGASGHLKMAPFLADGTYPSEYIMGITAHDIPNGDDGYVVHFGAVRGVDTSVWTAGDVVYASPTTTGGLTSTTPTAPNNIILVAAVVNSHAQNGELFVRPTLAANILNDEGIVYTNLADNDVLAYNSTTGVFENTSSLDLTTLTTTGGVTVGGIEVLHNGSVIFEVDSGGVLVSGSRVLTTADEGTGNGLDADTVDGLQASSFLRSNADDTATGQITFSGNLIIDNSTANAMTLYTEQGTAQIADTFADTTTFKSYITFGQGTSSNDPGYIMHETSDSETNEGVLHLAPSDDNAYGDYVSIHGTNDADSVKIHTNGAFEGVTSINGTAPSDWSLTSHNHTYDVNNAWLRDNGDNAHVKLYGNSRQMAFRTDGTTEYASGVSTFAFLWMYGGDAASNRRMGLNSSGQLWCSDYGYLHDKFADINFVTHSRVYDSGNTLTGNGNITVTLSSTYGAPKGAWCSVTLIPNGYGGFADIQSYNSTNVTSCVNANANGATANGYGFVPIDGSRRFTLYRYLTGSGTGSRIFIDLHALVY